MTVGLSIIKPGRVLRRIRNSLEFEGFCVEPSVISG